MKSFKDYLKEQVMPEGSSTLDPEFLEKKSRKDTVQSEKETKKMEKVMNKAMEPVPEE